MVNKQRASLVEGWGPGPLAALEAAKDPGTLTWDQHPADPGKDSSRGFPAGQSGPERSPAPFSGLLLSARTGVHS